MSGVLAILDTGTVHLEAISLANTEVDPQQAVTAVSFDIDGICRTTTDSDPAVAAFRWLLGGPPASYEVRVDNVTGTPDTGATGAWLSLGSSREWTLVPVAGAGSKLWDATVSMRAIGSSVTLASSTIHMTAETVL